MRARHLRRGGRHLRRPRPYQGWGPDPANDLAQVQSGHTPPMGFPKVVVPATPTPQYQHLSNPTRWLVAGVAVMAGALFATFAILALAFVLGSPPPATAETPVQPRIEQVTEIPDQRVRLTVTNERVKVMARSMCPHEDSCKINYVGDGTWVIEREGP